MNISGMVVNTASDFESHFVAPKKGRTLVVGSKMYATRPEDRRKRFTKVLGVDMSGGDGVDRVLNLEDDLPNDIGKFEHIDCVSTLEHSKRPWLLTENLERLLSDGGTIYLQVPFVWRIHAYPSDYWRFTTEGVKALLPRIKWRALQYVYGMRSGSIPNLHYQELLYFARTEVCGFGVKE